MAALTHTAIALFVAVTAPTVAVAPFTTTSAAEYQWIGPALAQALALRLHRQPELNAISIRQVRAAMRNDALAPDDLLQPEVSKKLARQLGADVLVVGQYVAAWPELELKIRVVDAKGQNTMHSVQRGLDELFDIEADVARIIARQLDPASAPNIEPAARNVRAWRALTLAQEILDWQSLSPRATAQLPKSAIRRAQQHLTEATQLDPDHAHAWALLGIALTLANDDSAALAAFAQAAAVSGEHLPDAVLGMSFLRARQERFDDAERVLQQAIARHPGFLHARAMLSELYTHRQRYPDAVRVFDDILARVPKQPWVLAQRGYAKAKQGNKEGAIGDSIAAVDLLPTSPYLFVELASRFIDADKLSGAEEALKTAMRLDPSNPVAYVRLGYVYLLQGKDELAVPVTEQALQSATPPQGRDRAYAHLNLVRAYGRRGELNASLAHLAEIQKLGGIALTEIDTDPALAALRAHPRYKELVP